ncbi:aldo/keto reductase [Pseudopedobacter beijingensis]|uniref:Aldo/keto reductase n=1 Tax=Pseudopedobacter beijingensis TaxID=1207056 RepID=A0ABW4ID45_9SPHI
MEYRKLGNTDLKLSAIAFGAWAAGGWMWGGSDENEAIKAIQSGFDEGMTSIDTAPIYGQGHSEIIVAKAVKNLGRDKIQILTKFGMRWDLAKGYFGFKSKNNAGEDIDIYKYAGKESIIKECEDSLKRLGTDYIDLYQIHWPDITTPIHETFEAISKLINDGKVRYAGVCNYNLEQMIEAEKTLNIVSNQIPYSMVRRTIEKEIVPYVLENHKAILAYSPLERGLLTGKIKEGYHFNEGDHRAEHPLYQKENLVKVNQFLSTLLPLAQEKNASLSQLVLRWTIDQPGITVALAGARNAEQAIQNTQAANIKLSKEDILLVNTEIEKLKLA